jgi:polypeptide N-acetylgalactosaminyltransferase
VLLVDDYSSLASYPHLGDPLEDWVALQPGVRLVSCSHQPTTQVRNERREGLIRSKNRGAWEARGEAVVFLDAHCEVLRQTA